MIKRLFLSLLTAFVIVPTMAAAYGLTYGEVRNDGKVEAFETVPELRLKRITETPILNQLKNRYYEN